MDGVLDNIACDMAWALFFISQHSLSLLVILACASHWSSSSQTIPIRGDPTPCRRVPVPSLCAINGHHALLLSTHVVFVYSTIADTVNATAPA